MSRYRGQRLAGAASEVFLHLLKARRDPPGSRQAVLAEQEYQCKLCAAPITAATCELDHIVSPSPHRPRTCRPCASSATGTKRPSITRMPRRHKPDHICHGIDVVRCRKNALAHARFPAPIFCLKDNMEQAREGHLADLTYVKLQEDGRWAAFPRLPYVGEGWYAKPAAASRPGTTSRGAWTPRRTWTRTVTQALQQMEAAWPQREEHYAKLSVNALIGLWARNMDLIYTMRTSYHQFDGSGCQHRELFLDAAGGMHWDHIT